MQPAETSEAAALPAPVTVGGLRILHFAETLPGGPASYLNQLLPRQVRAYAKVAVFCPQEQAHLLHCPGAEIVPFAKANRTAAGLIAIYRGWKAHLDRNAYDVLHLHSSFAGAIGRVDLQRRRERVVYCPHGWAMAREGASFHSKLYGLAERLLSLRADAIINISKSEEQLAQRAGIAPEKCALVYNGVEDAAWEPLPEGRQPTRLLFVGRYDRQKGIDLLIEAMETLSKHGFALTTIGAPVIGKPAVQKFPHYVTDLGWRTPEEIRRAMAATDIVVIPSRWEGFGLVAAEAMRAGRPVAASRVGGLLELILEECTGTLCTPSSSRSIADAVLRLAHMDVRQLGINARRRFERWFSAERMFREVDSIYRTTLAGRA